MHKIDSNILIGGFEGINNTAKLLLDKLNADNKLYLKNNFEKSVLQLINKLRTNNFNLIILIGQKPNIKSLKLESFAKKNNKTFITDYNFEPLKKALENLGWKVKPSSGAGTSVCNNIYFECLKFIKENSLKTEVVFLHIPMKKNINKLDTLAKDLTSIFS